MAETFTADESSIALQMHLRQTMASTIISPTVSLNQGEWSIYSASNVLPEGNLPVMH